MTFPFSVQRLKVCNIPWVDELRIDTINYFKHCSAYARFLVSLTLSHGISIQAFTILI